MDDPLAQAAVEPIESGMVVGLGTGRAASRCIRALAARRLDVRCVATSIRSAELATSLSLRVDPFEQVAAVDYLFDGADEVDPNLDMIKGAGGAMTREKMIAQVAQRTVYVIDESKLVGRLGERYRLPIELLAFGEASIQTRLEALGMAGTIRLDEAGRRILTDDGNPIVDVTLGSHTAESADFVLNSMPGVVGHGLFVGEADVVLIERADDSIERREAPRAAGEADSGG
ncbi:MAG: ribose-5-phosphate isomerase RpiA [Phycisphaerales bacterium]|nr:ribose-5-phosphate isomerase RpiA [Phycisphaerales bacterium]